MEEYKQSPCFITVKDHKKDWRKKVPTRLINGAKTDIGVISKTIMQKIIDQLKEKTKLNSFENTWEAIDWFKGLPQDIELAFISYDIENFYPNIKEDVLDKALEYARKF